MRLWVSLYLLIWVGFLAFPLGTLPEPGPVLPYLHALVGLAVLLLAYQNARRLRATTVPGRVKRIARATFQLSILMAVLGVLLWLNVGAGLPLLWGRSVWDLLVFLHLANAVAIVTQAAAVAIAYDMWEDREFLEETRPGEVPDPERPSTSRPAGLPKAEGAGR